MVGFNTSVKIPAFTSSPRSFPMGPIQVPLGISGSEFRGARARVPKPQTKTSDPAARSSQPLLYNHTHFQTRPHAQQARTHSHARIKALGYLRLPCVKARKYSVNYALASTVVCLRGRYWLCISGAGVLTVILSLKSGVQVGPDWEDVQIAKRREREKVLDPWMNLQKGGLGSLCQLYWGRIKQSLDATPCT